MSSKSSGHFGYLPRKIEKHSLYGDRPEFRALAMLYRTLIRLVSKTKTANGKYVFNILNYGENVDSIDKGVYILYDEENKHYDPSYIINKENPHDELTIFRHDDEAVGNLMDKFIREELELDDLFLQLISNNPSYEAERPTNANFLEETEQLFNMVVSNADINLPAHTDLSFAETAGQQLSSPIFNNNDIFDTPIKLARWNTDEISLSDDDNCESISFEQLFQTNISANELIVAMAQQTTTNPSMISNQEQEMKFKVEPALKFCGRRLSDFISVKALNRKGEPSEPKRPCYFADRNNHHYLNLLIPEAHLSADLLRTCLEICIVTREINGYTYIHPYFVFQIHATDYQAPNLNPIYRFLDSAVELKTIPSELLRELKLKLVVIMYTNKELMKSEQPLRIFSSPKNNSNGPPITTMYANHREFKKAYHLHDLCFAVTLWQKQPGEKVYRRCDDIQCISQISTEDETYTIPKE